MKGLHFSAMICFGFAILCYLISWQAGAGAAVFLGIVFEGIAWILIFHGRSESDSDDDSPEQ